MTTHTTSTAPVLPDLAASSGWTDFAIVGLVIIAALFYLYIKLWKNKGRCGGCNRCGKPPAANQQPQCNKMGNIASIRPVGEDNEKSSVSH